MIVSCIADQEAGYQKECLYLLQVSLISQIPDDFVTFCFTI